MTRERGRGGRAAEPVLSRAALLEKLKLDDDEDDL